MNYNLPTDQIIHALKILVRKIKIVEIELISKAISLDLIVITFLVLKQDNVIFLMKETYKCFLITLKIIANLTVSGRKLLRYKLLFVRAQIPKKY